MAEVAIDMEEPVTRCIDYMINNKPLDVNANPSDVTRMVIDH